jgi:NAD(P)-dependent dehydrogenase (short-subunit alcohol dehydrogenase family)
MKTELWQKELYTLEDCFSLKGRNVVVIGGAGKMSESFSKALILAGCNNLVIADKDNLRLKEVGKKLCRQKSGCRVHIYKLDAANQKDLSGFFKFLKGKIKHVDVLVYAVMGKPKDYYAPSHEYKSLTWNKVIDQDLSGAFWVTQKLLPIIRPNASLIFISSVYGIVAPDQRIYEKIKSNIYDGKYPLSQPAVYSASKAGIIGLARYLATYLSGRHIRVNVLIPGGVYDKQAESFYREYVKRVPLKRMAAWTDFNGAILFLASQASRYMTGQLLVVDGGWSAW